MILVAWFSAFRMQAQGNFQNMGFERAAIPPLTPVGSLVPITTALPGWSGYFGNNSGSVSTPEIGYDFITLGAQMITLIDAASPSFAPIAGLYSVGLFGSVGVYASISQTGMVPVEVRSVLLDLLVPNSSLPTSSSAFNISLDGQSLNVVALKVTPNYTEFGADISPFAGSSRTLAITALAGQGSPNIVLVDNVMFSAQAVPEPTTWTLFSFAAVGLWCASRRQAVGSYN